MDALTCAMGLEALGYGCHDGGLVFSVCAHILACIVPISKHGTEEQKQRYLPGLCDGSLIGMHAITEPDAGETHPYQPNSPYSASKAASDHLVRACHHTYSLPVLTTHCSNNYGPYHFPEKLIPLVITHALAGKPLPVYGDGRQIRDWLYVKDHCSALRRVLEAGDVGETYNIGGWNEKTNIEIVRHVCTLLDSLRPRTDRTSYHEQISFVADRPGHDRRYAIDASKIGQQLGWKPAETFESGIAKTVQWYLNNPDWVSHVLSGAYREWINKNYTNRI
ncbi:hypothetical protein B566_EDAN019096 [Ephemera danica]|nr:hypothetical protein B566_EDAN019096 [Ephemera danica]